MIPNLSASQFLQVIILARVLLQEMYSIVIAKRKLNLSIRIEYDKTVNLLYPMRDKGIKC